RWPDANVGIRTGAGLAVLDIDPRNGGDWRLSELELARGALPSTPIVLTGGGGTHYYLTTPAALPSIAGAECGLGDGVDLKAEAGFVVAPPSRHASGDRYRWDLMANPGEIALGDLPEWVAELAGLRPPRAVRRRVGDTADKPQTRLGNERYRQGSRNAKLTSIAGGLRRDGADELTILAELRVHNEAADPPLSERELAAIARSVAKYPPAPTPPPVSTNGAHPKPAGDAAHDPYPLTELGNAQRLIARYGQTICYTAETGWLVWDGRRWIRSDGHVERAMAEVARSLSQRKPAEKAMVKFAADSEKRAAITAAIHLASSDSAIRASFSRFDAQPWLLNVANGTLDLATGDLLPHAPERYQARLAPVPYDAAADCPRWRDFVLQMMHGDADTARYLQKVAGYCLTGSTAEQCVFLFYGTGQNGKSTFLEVLRAVLGDYARHVQTRTFMERGGDSIPNDIARLAGARLVTAAEVKQGQRLDEEMIKQISGGEPITARFLHHEYFEFSPTFKLLMGVNHKPRTRGVDRGLWRRIRLVPFTHVIPDADRVPDYAAQLLAQEAAGILAWAVEGCRLWRTEGMEPSAMVLQATAEYRAEMDSFGEFMDELCELTPDGVTPAAALYAAYVQWCGAVGEHPMSKRAFGQTLGERGLVSGRTTRERVWLGIRLRGVDL
ncbi:MAG: bifunctional DNA primase/polymerase, partial [Thermomicrobiales bacterium]|nr:bifunctional DNA primase/polymerase [Thermomicrobiales bacterium]